MWIKYKRCHLVQVLLLAVDKKKHTNKSNVLHQGVFCSRMKSCLNSLHPFLFLNGFEEHKGLLAEVKLLEADGIKVWRSLVSPQPVGQAACKSILRNATSMFPPITFKIEYPPSGLCPFTFQVPTKKEKSWASVNWSSFVAIWWKGQ